MPKADFTKTASYKISVDISDAQRKVQEFKRSFVDAFSKNDFSAQTVALRKYVSTASADLEKLNRLKAKLATGTMIGISESSMKSAQDNVDRLTERLQKNPVTKSIIDTQKTEAALARIEELRAKISSASLLNLDEEAIRSAREEIAKISDQLSSNPEMKISLDKQSAKDGLEEINRLKKRIANAKLLGLSDDEVTKSKNAIDEIYAKVSVNPEIKLQLDTENAEEGFARIEKLKARIANAKLLDLSDDDVSKLQSQIESIKAEIGSTTAGKAMLDQAAEAEFIAAAQAKQKADAELAQQTKIDAAKKKQAEEAAYAVQLRESGLYEEQEQNVALINRLNAMKEKTAIGSDQYAEIEKKLASAEIASESIKKQVQLTERQKDLEATGQTNTAEYRENQKAISDEAESRSTVPAIQKGFKGDISSILKQYSPNNVASKGIADFKKKSDGTSYNTVGGAAAGKLAAFAAEQFKKVISNLASLFKTTFAEAFKNLSDMAKSNASTTLISDTVSRNQQLEFGLTGAQNYAMSTTMKMMGMSGTDDVMWMNAGQKAKYKEITDKLEAQYTKLESTGIFATVQEFQLDIAMMKQEFTNSVYQFIANHKSELENLIKLGFKFIEGALQVFMWIADIASWLTGGTTEAATDITSTATTNNSTTSTDNSNNSKNVTVTNYITGSGTDSSSKEEVVSEALYRQALKALGE